MRFKHKEEKYPKEGETRIRKKFAWKPVELRKEHLTVWLGWYYIKERFIPHSQWYNNHIEKYNNGKDYDPNNLKGIWDRISIATKEQMFIDEL